MQVKRYNISRAGRKYKKQDGQEKTQWDNVGTMTEFYKDDGTISRILEIPAIGLDANIFPIEPRQNNYNNNQGNYNQQQQPSNQEMQGMAQAVGGQVVDDKTEIKVEDIPF